jgi:hypothetical protein
MTSKYFASLIITIIMFEYFLVILVLAIFSIIIVQFSSSILDFVLPKNKSRPHRLQIEMEYFLDQDKFFRLIMIHLTAAILIGKIALVAIGAMFIAYFQYICGMFTIARYGNKNIKTLETMRNYV